MKKGKKLFFVGRNTSSILARAPSPGKHLLETRLFLLMLYCGDDSGSSTESRKKSTNCEKDEAALGDGGVKRFAAAAAAFQTRQSRHHHKICRLRKFPPFCLRGKSRPRQRDAIGTRFPPRLQKFIRTKPAFFTFFLSSNRVTAILLGSL